MNSILVFVRSAGGMAPMTSMHCASNRDLYSSEAV
ncbi:hypothetical protein EV130_10655 [Rhizobium azibense]|uniref:Uncharacterized protein n=1 Tax=Rhizobium azibense TaxID=1136135 RepID=A0A4R3QSP2_9HYPH|nr:hypothetical protein EV130_10655 [Rhizobium azibense]TCU39210.1 hypothetical protein EV129_10355 [Rhizobium azibense]